MKFSEKLQILRKENKLSQEQLADMLDVSRQSVSKWESGQTYPEMDKLLSLCKIFKCSLDELTNDEITEKDMGKKQKSTFSNLVYEMFDLFDRSFNMFKSMPPKDLSKCIVELLILFFVLLVFKIPFEYINDLGKSIFANFGPISNIFMSLWNFIINIIYLVLFIVVFVYIFKSRYLDNYKFVESEVNEKKVTNNSEEKKEVNKEIEKQKDENKKSYVVFDVLGNIFNFFAKLCLIFFVMPFIGTYLGLFSALIVTIILLAKGVIYISVLLGIISGIIVNSVIIEIVANIIFNKKINFKRILILFLASIAGIGMSFGIGVFEIASTKFISGAPKSEILITEKKELDFNDKMYIQYYYDDVEYVVDESLKNKIIINTTYYKDYVEPNIYVSDNEIHLSEYFNEYEYLNRTIELLIDNLQDKRIYDYRKLQNVKTKVVTSKANIETMKKNRDKINQQSNNNYNDSMLAEYQSEIESLRNENDELNNTISELNTEMDGLKNKIEEYKETLHNLIEE